MKKLLFTLIVIFIGVCMPVNAQLIGSIKLSPDEVIADKARKDSVMCDIISRAVKPGLFLTSQSFQIRDEDDGIFGLNGNIVFGIGYGVGLKTPTGYCLTDNTVYPWRHNRPFQKYKDNYTPVYYEAAYADLNDTIGFVPHGTSWGKADVLCDSTVFLYESDKFSETSLKLDTQAGDKSGWIVWLVADKDADMDNLSGLRFECVETSLTVNGVYGESVPVKAPQGVSVYGGVMTVPRFKGIGHIELKVCGVLTCRDGQWNVCFPFLDRSEPASSVVEQDNESLFKITPVGEQPKKKSKDKSKPKGKTK